MKAPLRIGAWAVLLFLGLTPSLQAQPALDAALGSSSSTEEPLLCWWRTSTGAVHVGEVFSIVLTCSAVETPAVTAVVTEDGLDPSAIQLQPFEIIGGERAQDLRTPERRFFQYEYRTRLISQDQFDKDVNLPELKITYKVRSDIEGNAIEGRDQTYRLLPVSIRLLSLVPATATDIRDMTRVTFADVDREQSLARVLRLSAGIVFALAALPLLVALVRPGRFRGRVAAPWRTTNGAVLRQVGRELATIQAARQSQGWTDDLIARLTTAVRILAAHALSLPVHPRAVSGRTRAPAGQLAIPARRWRGKKIFLAGWVTPAVIAEQRAMGQDAPPAPAGEALLDELESSLRQLTSAQYGREQKVDDQIFDDALASAGRMLRRVKLENIWVVRKVRSLRHRPEPGERL